MTSPPMMSGMVPEDPRAPRRPLEADGLSLPTMGWGTGFAAGASSMTSSSKSSRLSSASDALTFEEMPPGVGPPIRSDRDGDAVSEGMLSPPMIKSCRGGLGADGTATAGGGGLLGGSSPPMIMSTSAGVEAGRSPPKELVSSISGSPISASSGRGRVFLGEDGFLGARAMAKR